MKVVEAKVEGLDRMISTIRFIYENDEKYLAMESQFSGKFFLYEGSSVLGLIRVPKNVQVTPTLKMHMSLSEYGATHYHVAGSGQILYPKVQESGLITLHSENPYIYEVRGGMVHKIDNPNFGYSTKIETKNSLLNHAMSLFVNTKKYFERNN